MAKNKRETGSLYEKKAAKYLSDNGYSIIEMNYRCTTGEIDIIAMSENTLIFCEVKYRSTARYGLPEEAVDYRKQKKIRKVASYYLNFGNCPEYKFIRFDVIALLSEKINHIKDAF